MACPLLCMLLADMSSCLAFKALHCVMTVVILWCQRVNSLKKTVILSGKIKIFSLMSCFQILNYRCYRTLFFERCVLEACKTLCTKEVRLALPRQV